MEPQSTTLQDVPQVVSSGVDSLYLGYRLDVPRGVVRQLEAAKQRAIAAQRVGRDPRTGEDLETVEAAEVELGGVTFEVRPYGSSSGTYLLWRDGMLQIAVNPDARSGAPSVTVKVLSEALWRAGASKMLRLVDDVARAIGTPVADDEDRVWRYVQRIDVCCDFQGWEPKVSDFELFSCNGAPTKTLHPVDVVEETLEAPRMWSRWQLTGFRFGQSSVIVRLYDKRAETKVSGKGWFESVWGRGESYDPALPVWRLELQLPRAYLKTVRTLGGEALDTVEDVLANLAPMWRTILSDRIRLTNGDATRLCRASTRPAWQALAETIEIDGVLDGEKVTKLEQDTITAEALLPKVRGYLAKYGALRGVPELDDLTLEVGAKVRELCEERGEAFEELVKKKQAARAAAETARARMDELAYRTRAARAREVESLKRRFGV